MCEEFCGIFQNVSGDYPGKFSSQSPNIGGYQVSGDLPEVLIGLSSRRRPSSDLNEPSKALWRYRGT